MNAVVPGTVQTDLLANGVISDPFFRMNESDVQCVVSGTVETALMSLKTGVVKKENLRVRVPANASVKIPDGTSSGVSERNSSAHYFRARLLIEDDIVSENRYFAAGPVNLQLAPPNMAIRLLRTSNGTSVLFVSANVFVKALRMEIDDSEAAFGDNYFDLDSKDFKEIIITSRQTGTDLLRRIRVLRLEYAGWN
jgi:hypothetical protein